MCELFAYVLNAYHMYVVLCSYVDLSRLTQVYVVCVVLGFFFFKQKTAYEI